MKVLYVPMAICAVVAIITPATAQQNAISTRSARASASISTRCEKEVRRWCPQTSEPDRHACIGADKRQFSNQCKRELEKHGY